MPPVAKDEAAGAATSHHGAVRSSVVLFLSSEGTHLCRCGDVKPAPLPPHMRGTPTPSMRGQTSSTPTCSFSPITEEMLHHLATTATSAASSSHAGPSSPLFSTLRGLLLGRDVVLILPLSWAPASMEKLLLLLMHEKVVGIASAVVLSDVMASSMASGVADGVVLHCSSTHYTFGRVLMGATVRYASSRCGSLSRVRATAKTALDGGVEEDLSSAAFRGELVEAFGFRCYKRAWEEFTMRRLLAAGGGGKGKGKGRKRVREEAEPEDWWRHYTKQDRLRPGTLEVLLARVLEKGKHPAMLVGEGLRIPFMAELMHHLLRRCRPEATLKAVGRSSNTRAAPTSTAVVNVDENKDDDSDDEEEEEESESSDDESAAGTSSEESSAVSSESSHEESSAEDEEDPDEDHDDDDDNVDEDEDEEEEEGYTCLVPQILPIPEEPWWLPVIGASVVGQLTEKELMKMRITPADVAQTKGSVVRWKAIL